MRNLNLLFNMEYYKKLGTSDFENDVIKCNEKLTNACFNYQKDYIKPAFADVQSFVLKLLYPGLLIGSGNPHGAGDIGNSDEDINMGFSFDYVSGQPFIPGSSVKGVLRSHFKYHTEAVAEILKSEGYSDTDLKTVSDLEKQIFDNSVIFFDAVIFRGDADGKLLGFDYITPHSSATKNPVPIRILKVLPDVQLEFRFRISDKEINGIKFTADKIKCLFQELILLFGAGAKTNVGYGVFDKDLTVRPKTKLQAKSVKNSGKKKQKKNTAPFQGDMPEWKKKLKGFYS